MRACVCASVPCVRAEGAGICRSIMCMFGICMSKSRLSCVAVLSYSLGHVSYELGDFEHVLQ